MCPAVKLRYRVILKFYGFVDKRRGFRQFSMFKQYIFALAGYTRRIMVTTTINKRWKKWLIAFFILLLAGGAVAWYIFTEKFSDTNAVKADYTVNAMDLIKAFQQNSRQANDKYSEKIIVVNGVVSAVETADTTANIKMTDSLSGSYIIFAFQEQHLTEAKSLKAGDRVSIKGSCSGGVHSAILDVDNISFKRCAVSK